MAIRRDVVFGAIVSSVVVLGFFLVTAILTILAEKTLEVGEYLQTNLLLPNWVMALLVGFGLLGIFWMGTFGYRKLRAVWMKSEDKSDSWR